MKKFRLLLVGNYAPDKQYSMLAYADLLYEGLAAAGVDVQLIAPKQVFGRIPVLRKWFGYFDKFCLFIPRLVWAAHKTDLVHICDHSNAMYVRWVATRPHVVSCHDLFAILGARGELKEHKVRFTGRVFQSLIMKGLMKAGAIISVSNKTTSELILRTEIDARNICTIENGLNYPYEPMLPEKFHIVLGELGISSSESYILHVGRVAFYKNHFGLLKIFSMISEVMPELKLVLVGAKLDEKLNALVDELGIRPKIQITPYVCNESLRALYSGAEAFIFPSLMEGFGWPLIEAQACGCPVFASDIEPITDLGGDASIYFDPKRYDAAASIILQNWDKRQVMHERGLANVKARFSSQKMIKRYVQEYVRVLNGQ